MSGLVGSVMAAVALLAQAPAVTPVGLRCTTVKTWACEEGKGCTTAADDPGESYSFDLIAMTYQAPTDRGAITELETDDRGFMTFVLGSGRRYVHKNADEGDPMTSFLYLAMGNMRELRCTARYPTNAAEAGVEGRRKLAGDYYLSGVMETGSELLLRLDGSFAWYMSYGALDQEAQGRWRTEGDAVLLDAEPVAGRPPAFEQLRLSIEGGGLLLGKKGRYERRP